MHTIPFYLFWFNTDDQPIAVLSTVLPFLNLPGPQKRGIERRRRRRREGNHPGIRRGIHLHTNCFSFSLSQGKEKDHLFPSVTTVPPSPPPSFLCESSMNGEPHSVRMNGMGWKWVGGHSDHPSPPIPEPHVQHISIWSPVTAVSTSQLTRFVFGRTQTHTYACTHKHVDLLGQVDAVLSPEISEQFRGIVHQQDSKLMGNRSSR